MSLITYPMIGVALPFQSLVVIHGSHGSVSQDWSVSHGLFMQDPAVNFLEYLWESFV